VTGGRARRRTRADLVTDLEVALGRAPRAVSIALPWRWRYELMLAVGSLLAAMMIVRAVDSVRCLLGATLLGFAVGLWRPTRQALLARAWCVITPHRVRAGCTHARIHSRQGRLPIILRTSPEPFGERVLIWCIAGTCAEDFLSASRVLRTACWATDVRVARNARYAQLVTLDVIRRPAGPGSAAA
jgi:hypothetical protein